MRNLIIRICKYIIKKLSGIPNVDLPKIPTYVLEAATTHVSAMKHIEASGEWKRHQVYAKLIKEFPNINKRTLALSIEVALCFD